MRFDLQKSIFIRVIIEEMKIRIFLVCVFLVVQVQGIVDRTYFNYLGIHWTIKDLKYLLLPRKFSKPTNTNFERLRLLKIRKKKTKSWSFSKKPTTHLVTKRIARNTKDMAKMSSDLSRKWLASTKEIQKTLAIKENRPPSNLPYQSLSLIFTMEPS